MTGMLASLPVRILAQPAQPPATAEKQPQWKDRAEYDLFDAITKDSNPQTKLDKLQQWEKQYPTTEWIKARRTLFLTTYALLNKAAEAVNVAKQILADDPKDFNALYYTMFFTDKLSATPTPDILASGEKAAKAILENINTPPPNVTADQWQKARTDVEVLAHRTLGWIGMQRADWGGSEAEFQKTLAINSNNSDIDYLMGTSIASEKNVAKMSSALYYFARAAVYDGPGSLTPAGRQQVLDYVKRAYKGYHGSDAGFSDLVAAVKTTPIPPADFHIKSVQEIADEAAAAQAEKDKANPQLAMWRNIKAALTGADGANYFSSSMKDALLPTFTGKVVKLEPETKPKTIIIALEDGATGDATLKFAAPLPGKVDVGTELSFEGVPESYTASPFMVVFNVDKDKLHGWTGKNAPAAPVHHRPPPKK